MTTPARLLVPLLAACTTLAPASVGPALAPDVLHLGPALHRTVLPLDLGEGRGADLVVVDEGRDAGRRVRVARRSGGTWTIDPGTSLRPEVVFVDVATVGGRERLLTFEPGRVSAFDPATSTEHALVTVAWDVRPSPEGGLPRVDVTRDLDGDGLEDLVLPDTSGFLVARQRPDGSFLPPRRYGPPEPFAARTALGDDTPYGERGITPLTLPAYLSRVHVLDHDGDGRPDLAFLDHDHLDVHHQLASGDFSSVPRPVVVEVACEGEAYAMVFGYEDAGFTSLLAGWRPTTRRTFLQEIRDLTGDGVADLLTLTLEGRSPFRMRSTFAVHPGSTGPAGVTFAPGPVSSFRSGGRAGGMQTWGYATVRIEDLDGDGLPEVLLRQVDTGALGTLRAMTGNAVTVQVEVFHGEAGGAFAERPTAVRRVRPAFDPGGRHGVFFPAVALGDLDGDGLADLLMGADRRTASVFAGLDDTRHFADVPYAASVGMPADERDLFLADVDGDGRQDVVVEHADGPGGGARLAIHRVR